MFGKLKNLSKVYILCSAPTVVTSNEKQAIYQNVSNETETGLDRLYLMFTKDEFGELSPQLVNVLQVMFASVFAGGAIGGFIHSRNAFVSFVENNDATKFQSHIEAKKKLQDKVTIGFGKGAFMWAWRLTAFTGCYTILHTTISTYRDKTGIIEHIIAGGVTGVCYKANLGIRGTVVGGALGCVLGVISGLAINGLLYLSGNSMDDVRKLGYNVKSSRDRAWRKGVEAHIEGKEPEFIRDYKQKIKGTDPSLESV